MRRRLFPLLPACARRITHWCYNPLVLRHRTCCPVSNTLFFFFCLSTERASFCLLRPPATVYDAKSIGTHMHTLPPWTRDTVSPVLLYTDRCTLRQVFVESRQPELTNDRRNDSVTSVRMNVVKESSTLTTSDQHEVTAVLAALF